VSEPSCKECGKYAAKEKKCPIMFGTKQAWEWCTAYVEKVKK